MTGPRAPRPMALLAGPCNNCRDLPRPKDVDPERRRPNPAAHGGTGTARGARTSGWT